MAQAPRIVETKGLRTIIDKPGLLWLDLDDPMSQALDDLASRFRFHELAVEDCRHFTQLAKLDYFDDHIFVIVTSTLYTEVPCELRTREIDMFVGPDYIVTVHMGQSKAVSEVERIIAGGGLHPSRPDQVLHSVVDIVVDRYLPTLESIGDTINKVEDDLLVKPDVKVLETIFQLKRGLLQFRRAVSSQRELLNLIVRDDTEFIHKETHIYFRDVYDHCVRAMELTESYRDLLSGSLDIYLTQMANRTNDVVKGLTILATILLPMTLITGYFGMNFEFVPLLKEPNGVWYITGGLLLISLGMFIFFKRKGWI